MRVKVDEGLPQAAVDMIRLYAPGTHAGALLLRPDQDGIRPVTELLGQVLESYRLEALASTVTGLRAV